MFTTILLTLSAASAPATGHDTNSTTIAAAMASKPAGTATGTAPARKPTSYCIVDTLTGSRLVRKICKTRDAWMAQGIDPLAAN